jgi:ABC-2 type transport system permease protein
VDSRVAIYARLARSRIRGQTQYRLSFALSLVGTFFFTFLDFVTILVIFTHLPQLAGWTFPEIAFLYGSSYVTFKAADLAMTNLDRLPLLIRMGTFDQILTRPLGTLGQVMTSDIGLRQAASMAQGAAVFVYALSRLSIHWTIPRVAVFAASVVSAFFIFCAIFVATNAIAFWVMDAREIANSFTYGGQMVTQYPLNIFGLWFRRLLGFVIPLAFVAYFPALYVLGKHDPLGAPYVFRFLSPAVAAAAVLVTGGIWRVAIRRYRSTGS